mmetsp:Transcript_24048/g.33675  ORF Transcript_24048/g.33675 Transcript_24048/m.33675 type:complete len:257 (-) Transcript_24048:472-1242(-)
MTTSSHGFSVLLVSSVLAASPPCTPQKFRAIHGSNIPGFAAHPRTASSARRFHKSLRNSNLRPYSETHAAPYDEPSNGEVEALLNQGVQNAMKNPQESLMSFQKVIQMPSDVVTIHQRQAAFWNTACIFLKFGDLSKAEQSISNAFKLGLDLERAKCDPNLLALQGSSQKMEDELWRYAQELSRKGPEAVKLRPEMEIVGSELELAEGQDLRYTSIARRVTLLTLGTFALVSGLGALLYPGLQSPEPAADYYELPD